MWFWLGIILVVVAVVIIPTFYIVPQWERVALIRFGKIEQITETGLHMRIPLVDSQSPMSLAICFNNGPLNLQIYVIL